MNPKTNQPTNQPTSSGDLRSVEYFVIAITPKSTLISCGCTYGLNRSVKIICTRRNWFIDFNGKSTCIEQFYAWKLVNRIHWEFLYTFFLELFLESFFVHIYMISSITM